MTVLDILAVILAVLVLLKVLLWLVNPKYLLGVGEAMMKNTGVITVIFAVITLIVGYYIFQLFTIIEVGALLLFSTMLIGFGLIPLYPALLKSMKPQVSNRSKMFRMFWLAFLIWFGIAVWILYAVLR